MVDSVGIAEHSVEKVDGNGSPIGNSKAVNIDEILLSEDLSDVFRVFLESKCAEENLDAWKEFEEFKKTDFDTEEEKIKACERILDLYIVEGAPKQININYAARTKIESSVPNQITNNLFDEAQKELYVLLNHDCLPKFLESQLYRDYSAQPKRSQSSPVLSSPRLSSSPKSISWNGRMSKRTTKIFGKDLTDLPFSPPSSPFSKVVGLSSPRASSPIHSRRVKLRNRSGSVGRKTAT